MIKELKYIILTIVEDIKDYLVGSVTQAVKIRELNNMVLLFAFLEFLSGKWKLGIVTIGIYIIIYIYLTVREGKWKHKMRKSYTDL